MSSFRIWLLFAALALPVLSACEGIEIKPADSGNPQNEDNDGGSGGGEGGGGTGSDSQNDRGGR